MELSGTFFRMDEPWLEDIFPRCVVVPLRNIAEKHPNSFSWNFQDMQEIDCLIGWLIDWLIDWQCVSYFVIKKFAEELAFGLIQRFCLHILLF